MGDVFQLECGLGGDTGPFRLCPQEPSGPKIPRGAANPNAGKTHAAV
ncbi:MAG: hypothetical protein OIF54_13950 [Cohaesibacter sp.]|nr:hypothetical protein [Cohaesibacter sp.]